MTQAITIPAEAELVQEGHALSPIVRAAQAFEISDPVTYETAVERIRIAKRNRAKYDAQRKDITGPILLAKKRVDDLFRPVLGALDAIESAYRGKVNHYLSEQAKARAEAATVAALANGAPTVQIETHDGTVQTVAAEPVPPPPAAHGTTSIAYWAVRVTDPDLVPREFCCPDYDKLQALANAETGREIPGVVFERKERVVVR